MHHHIPHDIWVTALPRLLMASYALAIVMSLLIRVAFRPRRSYLSWRLSSARHARRLK